MVIEGIPPICGKVPKVEKLSQGEQVSHGEQVTTVDQGNDVLVFHPNMPNE